MIQQWVFLEVRCRDNGKEKGKCCFIIGHILGLYRNSGNEAGNDYLGFGIWFRKQRGTERLHVKLA